MKKIFSLFSLVFISASLIHASHKEDNNKEEDYVSPRRRDPARRARLNLIELRKMLTSHKVLNEMPNLGTIWESIWPMPKVTYDNFIKAGKAFFIANDKEGRLVISLVFHVKGFKETSHILCDPDNILKLKEINKFVIVSCVKYNSEGGLWSIGSYSLRGGFASFPMRQHLNQDHWILLANLILNGSTKVEKNNKLCIFEIEPGFTLTLATPLQIRMLERLYPSIGPSSATATAAAAAPVSLQPSIGLASATAAAAASAPAPAPAPASASGTSSGASK